MGEDDITWKSYAPSDSTHSYTDLRDALLDNGGEKVIPAFEEDLDELVEDGEVMSPDNRELAHRFMIPSQCHYNAARLYEDTPDGALHIATGYGLTEDGCWRQHSWLVAATDVTLSAYIDDNGDVHEECDVTEGAIIETTVPRVQYYGFILDDGAADEFCFLN